MRFPKSRTSSSTSRTSFPTPGPRPRHGGPRRRGTRPRGPGHRLAGGLCLQSSRHRIPRRRCQGVILDIDDLENEVLDVEDEVVDIEDLADIVYAREVVDIENIVLGILILFGFMSSRSSSSSTLKLKQRGPRLQRRPRGPCPHTRGRRPRHWGPAAIVVLVLKYHFLVCVSRRGKKTNIQIIN